MALQILVENAVKHNIASNSKPLHIRIYINDQNKLVVENNLQKKKYTGAFNRSRFTEFKPTL